MGFFFFVFNVINFITLPSGALEVAFEVGGATPAAAVDVVAAIGAAGPAFANQLAECIMAAPDYGISGFDGLSGITVGEVVATTEAVPSTTASPMTTLAITTGSATTGPVTTGHATTGSSTTAVTTSATTALTTSATTALTTSATTAATTLATTAVTTTGGPITTAAPPGDNPASTVIVVLMTGILPHQIADAGPPMHRALGFHFGPRFPLWQLWIIKIVGFEILPPPEHTHGPPLLGRRRLQDTDEDVYQVEFLVDGMTEEDSVELAGISPNDPGFEDAIKDELEEEFPGQDIEIVDVSSATSYPPVEGQTDAWKAGLAILILLLFIGACAVILIGSCFDVFGFVESEPSDLFLDDDSSGSGTFSEENETTQGNLI